MSDLIDKKPPTQVASVSGFVAFGVKTQEDVDRELQGMSNLTYDWRKIINLPAYQMYLHEKTGKSLSEEDAILFTQAGIQASSEEVFYQAYNQWHTDKGLWVNETAQGEVIDG